MIKSGGTFLFNGYRCVIGAVIPIKDRRYIAAASHLFHKAGTGSRIQVESAEGIVRKFMEDYDVALIELPPGCKTEVTELGSAAVMEEAMLVNEHHTIPCRVIRAGASLLYLQFPAQTCPSPATAARPSCRKEKS